VVEKRGADLNEALRVLAAGCLVTLILVVESGQLLVLGTVVAWLVLWYVVRAGEPAEPIRYEASS
jgi:hypothetical protein